MITNAVAMEFDADCRQRNTLDCLLEPQKKRRRMVGARESRGRRSIHRDGMNPRGARNTDSGNGSNVEYAINGASISSEGAFGERSSVILGSRNDSMLNSRWGVRLEEVEVGAASTTESNDAQAMEQVWMQRQIQSVLGKNRDRNGASNSEMRARSRSDSQCLWRGPMTHQRQAIVQEAVLPSLIVTAGMARKASTFVASVLEKVDVIGWIHTWGGATWYSVEKRVESALLELLTPFDGNDSSHTDSVVDWDAWGALGEAVLSHVEKRYLTLLSTDSEQRWMLQTAGIAPLTRRAGKIVHEDVGSLKGTGDGGKIFSDQISSLILLVQQSALCSRPCLQILLRLAAKSRRSASHAVAEQLAVLFSGPLLLPSFRKLRIMKQQSPWLVDKVRKCLRFFDSPQSEQNGWRDNANEDNQHIACIRALQMLLFWRLEEVFASAFSLFVDILRSLADDSLSQLSRRAVNWAARLLGSKKQQEQRLLSLLVYKLGSNNHKVASLASYQLAHILRRHSPMKGVVAAYVGDFVLVQLVRVLQTAKADAERTFQLLSRTNTRPTPATVRYRTRERRLGRSSLSAGSECALKGKQLFRARRLRILLKQCRGPLGKASKEAQAKLLEVLLPSKLPSFLQPIYRGLLFLSELQFHKDDQAAAAHAVRVYTQGFQQLASFSYILVQAICSDKCCASRTFEKDGTNCTAGDYDFVSNSTRQDDVEVESMNQTNAAKSRFVPLLSPLYTLDCFSRIVRVMLSGMHRAFPFLPRKMATSLLDEHLQEESAKKDDHSCDIVEKSNEVCSARFIQILYTLVHTLPCRSTRIVVMRLLHSLIKIHHLKADRLTRVVYEQLQARHGCLQSPRRAGLVQLVLGLLLISRNTACDAALIKRLMQESCMLDSVGVAAASVQIVDTLLPQRPQLENLVSQKEADLVDLEESFQDLTDDETNSSDRNRETELMRMSSCVYDPHKRDPRYSRASEARLWELSALSASFHPAVESRCKTLVSRMRRGNRCREVSEAVTSNVSESNDAGCIDEDDLIDILRSSADSAVLDLLSYKQRDAKQSVHISVISPRMVAWNSSRYWKRHEAKPEEEFVRKYFLDPFILNDQKRSKCRIMEKQLGPDGSEITSDDENSDKEDDAFSDDEVDEFLSSQLATQYGGDSEDDDDAESIDDEGWEGTNKFMSDLGDASDDNEKVMGDGTASSKSDTYVEDECNSGMDTIEEENSSSKSSVEGNNLEFDNVTGGTSTDSHGRHPDKGLNILLSRRRRTRTEPPNTEERVKLRLLRKRLKSNAVNDTFAYDAGIVDLV